MEARNGMVFRCGGGWRSGKRPVAGSPPRDETGKEQAHRDHRGRAGQDHENNSDCVRPSPGEDDQNDTGERNADGEEQKPPAWPPEVATLPLELRLGQRGVTSHQFSFCPHRIQTTRFARGHVITRTNSPAVLHRATSCP